MKTYEQYIEHILKDIEKRKTFDYGDRNSVRRYNAAADRIAKDVTAIEEQYPDRINDFFQLIYHPDTEVAHALAWYVYDRKSFSVKQKQEAIRVIQHLLDSGAIKGVAAVHTEFLLRHYPPPEEEA